MGFKEIQIFETQRFRCTFVNDSNTIFFNLTYIFINMKYILFALLVFCIMEGITWLTHRYVMHGFLWYLHKDHHQKGDGFFEKNDAFFIIFAVPSWLCIMLGSMNQNYWVCHY